MINYMSRKQKRLYRQCLFGALIMVLMVGVICCYWWIQQQIPGELVLYQDKPEQLDLQLPFLEMSISSEDLETAQVSVDQSQRVEEGLTFWVGEPVSMTAGEPGSMKAQIKLFGVVPCKKINLDVKQEVRIMPVGKAVGLYIHAKGVMVLGTGKVSGTQGETETPAYHVLQSGDYIRQVNGKRVNTIKEVSELIQNNGEKQMILGVVRGDNYIQVKIKPVQSEDGAYQIGAWLREDTEGIGTLSFVTRDNQFAALGHGITDADTGMLITLKNGGLYPATIESVVKGKSGSPGEVVGSVLLGSKNRLGTIDCNTSLGITGEITDEEYQYQENRSMMLGHKQEVEKGKATILCQLGEKVEEYEIEIEKINLSSTDNKGMEIHVTDEKLIKKTGGIVQGMSGAPIIQNGKCIGAVTHVFVKDATRGYATFIESMF